MDLPKGVQRVKKRLADGSVSEYFYWRPTGTKLPDPSDPGFEAAIRAAKAAHNDRPKAGTFGALVIEYKRSPDFRKLGRGAQKAYDRALERLRDFGPVQVAEIHRRDILQIRDALALTAPQAANQLVMVMSVLMEFAIDREWRETNPCARLGRLPGGEHRRWPEPAIAYALKNLPEPFRRAVVLALYTGQREGDCCRMRWGQYDGTGIALRQQKTAAQLWIPAHRALKVELDAWRAADPTSTTILTNTLGKPWRVGSFATRFSTILRDHPALDGLVFHGLRKAAAARLAEAGCSLHEIASITGHETLQMIAHYTKEADQRRRAVAAIRRLELVSDSDCKLPKTDT